MPCLGVLAAVALAAGLLWSVTGREGAASVLPRPGELRADLAGVAVPCRVVEVYDGDTLTCRITLDVRVRLLDCWAAEVRGGDAAAKARGDAARGHLRQLAQGRDALLRVPWPEDGRLDRALSLGRVLGRVSIDGQDLSEAQVEAGHATREKPSD